MSTKPSRYHLRFQVVPDGQVAAKAASLLRFCKAHGVEEVVLFFAAEEWNNGLLSQGEEDTWFDTVRTAKALLDEGGIITSLNPWMTALHCDRGRAMPVGRSFAPIVSPIGEVSRACASFADPDWQRYLCNLYAHFAALGFRTIWVEDDFRYHNHGPLTWGGGFEQGVLDRFARKIGQAVSREEVVGNIVRPGEPHPWRALWMETWRELQLEVLAGLADAVRRVAPATTLGAMTSLPSVHSAEGRDWTRFFGAFSIEGRVAHRPHFAPYGEVPGKAKDYSILMLDLQRALRPAACEVAPEIENFPFTNWQKSDAQTWCEMALATFFGSDALLLDLFPFSGNAAAQEPAIGKLLDRSRPALEWIAGRFPATLQTQGVGLPWWPDAQAHVRTRRGESLYEWDATSLLPGRLLLPYGIAVTARKQTTNAVFGSLAWAIPHAEVEELLADGLLLDGDSAAILAQRGYGELLGVEVLGCAGREEDTYAMEQVVHAPSGVKLGWRMNANLLERMYRLSAMAGAREWTRILRADGTVFGAGMVAHQNALGGRVITLSAPNPGALPQSNQRQRIFQRAVAYAAPASPPTMVTGGAQLMPVHFRDTERNHVLVLNGSPDAARPVVHVPGSVPLTVEGTVLSPMKPARPTTILVAAKPGGWIARCRTEVPYLGYLVLEW